MRFKLNIHFIFVIIAASLWGTAGLFVRTISNYGISQMQTVFFRGAISAILLAVLILFRDIKLFKVKLRDIWIFILAGLFSIVLFNYSYYTTMSLASLSVAAVLLYTAPFFVVILSAFLFKEKLTINKSIACIMAFIGCCFVSGLFASRQRISSEALFFGLLTGFGYALYTIFGKILLEKGYKTLTITFYIFLSASVCTIPFINVADTVNIAFSNLNVGVTVFLMALINTVAPYILYTTGLSGTEPSIAPVIATLEPVVATVIGAVFYNEAITFSTIFGISLVLLSVIILNIKHVQVKANAKVNLSLDIIDKRDDGYHLIDSVMQSVSLADKIKVYPSKKIKVICNDKGLNNEDNIAYKAAKLYFKETKINGGAIIKISKKIPQAAGLGGGSADAAAVILALDKLYETKLSKETFKKMALELGADVPFFIEGGTVRAEGIGEKLTKLESMKNVYILLAKAENKPSTAEMYKKIDEQGFFSKNTENLIKALKNNDIKQIGENLSNAFASVWQNSPLQKKLLELDSDGVSLSGSGPTWFAIFSDKKRAKKAYLKLKDQKVTCFLAKSSEFAIVFE